VRMEPVWCALGQAAGVAAALAIDRGLELADVPVEAIQEELLRQKCLLFFYVDVPAEAPEFQAVQKLSLLGAVGDIGAGEIGWREPGDEGSLRHPDAYRFRPDDAVTRAEFARMLVKGLRIPVSVTAAHFHDAPRGHFAFPFLETLYDRSSRSTEPFLDYDVRREGKRPLAFVHPDRPLRAAEAARILAGVLERDVPAGPEPDAELSRAAAAMLIARHAAPPAAASTRGGRSYTSR